MKKCSFCDEESVFNYPVPTSVKTTDGGTIEKVFKDDILPVCEGHFLKIKERYVRAKYPWIEKILEKKYQDGFKRITNLVLLPYFINFLEIEEEEAVEKIMRWYRLCEFKRDRTEVMKEARYVKRRGYKPLTRENFDKKLGGLVWSVSQ